MGLLVSAVLAMSVIGGLPGAGQECADVQVVVDLVFFGGSLEAGCAAAPVDNLDALEQAGFTPTATDTGFGVLLCAIDALPASGCEPREDGRFWQDWYATADGGWERRHPGGASAQPSGGGTVGWAFGDGTTPPGTTAPPPPSEDPGDPGDGGDGAGGGSPLPEGVCCNVQRLAGADPVATAINVAQHVVPAGQARRVLIARDDDFPDSLVGGSYVFDDSPILLTDPVELDPRVASEIRRLAPDQVTILGGHAAISGEVEEELVELGHPVNRIAGVTRSETASTVALAVEEERAARDQSRWAPRRTLTFARAHPDGDPSAAYADSLASAQMGAYFAYPSILSDTDRLAPESRMFLEDHIGQFDRAFVWGGDAALSNAVTDEIREVYDGEGYRIFGPSREETALEIGLALQRELADAYGSSDGRITRALLINLRQGWEAPLVSALIAGEAPTVYLPVTGDGGQVHPATVAYVCDPAHRAAYGDIDDVVVVASAAEVSDDAVDQALDVLGGTGC